MNLLIEQRPRSNLHQQSSITSRHDMNNSSSSSLVLKLKRHQQSELHSPEMANEDNSQSLSTTTNPRLKRLITNPATATRRPSSPAFNGKQQVNKRSVTIDNNNNDLTGNTEDKSCSKRFKSDELHPISSNKVDASVETVSIGLATEPDQLGPCEPGTSVVLEGIVWNETDSGVLVVNVTWRGKTYVGTLLDSTKQDWACPRLICESPTSDHDARQSNKSSRTKRGNTNRLSNPSFISSFASSLTCPLPVSTGVEDRKLRHNIKSRQSKRTNVNVNDEISANQSSQLPSPSRPTCLPAVEAKLIPCSESQCYKQFTSPMALHFHMSDAHRQSEEIASIPPQPPSTRDEEDVAHILVNVAEYVRRASPPLLPKRSSPEHQQRSTALSWPCPQISSKLVLSSSLNNNEQTLVSPLANTSRPIINNADTNLIDNSIKTEDVKSADHFLLHIHDPPPISSPPLLPNTYPNITSWMNTKTDPINPKKSSTKIPSPSLPLPASSFVPIHPVTTIPMPPTSSSPAYSDISDEDSPSRNENDQIPPPPSTINLLTAPHEKFDEHEQTFIPATRWTTQMLLQQYGSYMQQQQPFVGTHTKETTSNRLNSKPTHSLCSNGTSDSTVKNILDARRLSTTKPSSPSSLTSGSNVYHYHTTSLTSDSLLNNTLTSPNENLLKPSSAGNPLDYSLNPSSCSSSLHSSR